MDNPVYEFIQVFAEQTGLKKVLDWLENVLENFTSKMKRK